MFTTGSRYRNHLNQRTNKMLINFLGLIVSIITIIAYLISITTEDTSEPCTGFEISAACFIASLMSYFFYSSVIDIYLSLL